MNKRNLFQLYRQECFGSAPKAGRQAHDQQASAHGAAVRPNLVLSLNLVDNALSLGRRFRVLCIVDYIAREAIDA